MSNNKTIDVSGGIGLAGLVFIVLLILKLTNLAPAVTWFWVFFPLWIGPAVVLGVFTVIGLVVGVIKLFRMIRRRIRRW